MSATTEHRIDAGDVTLHVERIGERGRRTVVFAHGFTDHGRCWARVVDALGDRFDAVLVDARNHGRSGTAVGGAAAQAQDLATVITSLGLANPVLVGHSMGANAAAVLVADRPGLVSRLVVEDPPWRSALPTSDAAAQRIAQLTAFLEHVIGLDDAGLVELGRRQHGDWDEADLAAWRAAKRLVRVEAAGGLELDDWRETVSRLSCPTLLVRGDPERGGVVTPRLAIEAASLNDRLVSRPVVDAGHNIRRENLQGFLDVVVPFLDE
ncbi:MAG: alpha/beta hydrolase [Actinomycetota bacterium]